MFSGWSNEYAIVHHACTRQEKENFLLLRQPCTEKKTTVRNKAEKKDRHIIRMQT